MCTIKRACDLACNLTILRCVCQVRNSFVKAMSEQQQSCDENRFTKPAIDQHLTQNRITSDTQSPTFWDSFPYHAPQ